MSAEIIMNGNNIRQKIHTIRGQQVMLDSDLAEIYGVEAKRLNEQVKRNIDRFPAEFRFQLTQDECDTHLRSQFVIASEAELLRSQIATLDDKRGKAAIFDPPQPSLFHREASEAKLGGRVVDQAEFGGVWV